MKYFVQRQNGKVVSLFSQLQPNVAEEELDENHPDILTFNNPTYDLSAIDQATLNAALAQDGSVTRALGIVMFKEINKLRANAGLTQYTMPQFVAALKAEMRS